MYKHGGTLEDVAAAFGLSREAIRVRLIAWGVKRRRRGARGASRVTRVTHLLHDGLGGFGYEAQCGKTVKDSPGKWRDTAVRSQYNPARRNEDPSCKDCLAILRARARRT